MASVDSKAVRTKPPEPPSATAATAAKNPNVSNAQNNAQSQKQEQEQTRKKKPTVMIVIGMAGTGKTTLMQRVNAYVHQKKWAGYTMNLDPAVSKVPYGCNIDIRDTVDYAEVMKQYKLGPNGGIMTSLNLFSTRFNQAMGFVEKKAKDKGLKYVMVDTPGQIEVFTWSASGTIITDSLASTFPTVLVYVIDTPRTTSPVTFMSNMLYACSIMYKTKLPFVIVFNKIDIVPHKFAQDWMQDFEIFQEALDADQDDTYMASLTRSMSLVLDEFYATITSVGVSAATGEGMDSFFEAIDKAAEEYYEYYLPELEARMNAAKDAEEAARQKSLARLRKDMEKDGILEEGEKRKETEKQTEEEVIKSKLTAEEEHENERLEYEKLMKEVGRC